MPRDPDHSLSPSVELFIRSEMVRRGIDDFELCRQKLIEELQNRTASAGFRQFLLDVPDTTGLEFPRDRTPSREFDL